MQQQGSVLFYGMEESEIAYREDKYDRYEGKKEMCVKRKNERTHTAFFRLYAHEDFPG
jgi:hypothetical protein